MVSWFTFSPSHLNCFARTAHSHSITHSLQARAVLTFLDAVSEKKLRSTVALTAARGRGKSAALGLCLAGAIAYGYANIFVTAPSPENLKTVFEFLLKGERERSH
jgi:tRNA(Met) C34 N-acetyltransferase TmcA